MEHFICKKTDRSEGQHVKQNKPDTERRYNMFSLVGEYFKKKKKHINMKVEAIREGEWVQEEEEERQAREDQREGRQN
jgi:hypothetical protein